GPRSGLRGPWRAARAGVQAHPAGKCGVTARIAVVDAAESSRIGVVPDMSTLQLSCDAAMAAISTGLCEVVLVTHGGSGRSRRAGESFALPTGISPEGQFEVPYGTG